MIRSERLFRLERLLRSKKVTRLKDLCREFGVSERTIYRDIRSLSNVDVPVYFENGYRLESNDAETTNPLSDDEELLILFCLHNNPLRKYRVMRQRLDRLTRKLTGMNLLMNRERSQSFSFGERFVTKISEDDRNLRVFLRSVSRKVNVRIRLVNHDLEERVYKPISVMLTKHGPKFVVRGVKSGMKKTLKFDIVETVTEL